MTEEEALRQLQAFADADDIGLYHEEDSSISVGIRTSFKTLEIVYGLARELR